MASIEVKVPDIGDFDGIPVIELLVAVGDTVRKDQGLVTLESDKATMEVPSSADGVVKELKVKVGDKVGEGAVIAILESAAVQSAAAAEAPPKSAAPAAPPTKRLPSRLLPPQRRRRPRKARSRRFRRRPPRRPLPKPSRRSEPAARPTSNAAWS